MLLLSTEKKYYQNVNFAQSVSLRKFYRMQVIIYIKRCCRADSASYFLQLVTIKLYCAHHISTSAFLFHISMHPPFSGTKWTLKLFSSSFPFPYYQNSFPFVLCFLSTSTPFPAGLDTALDLTTEASNYKKCRKLCLFSHPCRVPEHFSHVTFTPSSTIPC